MNSTALKGAVFYLALFHSRFSQLADHGYTDVMNFEGGYLYHPGKLEHVKGQEGRVGDIDKAEVMAAVEDEYRWIADVYETYITGGKASEEYPIMPFNVAEFKRLKEEEEEEEDGESVNNARMEKLLEDEEVRAYDADPEAYEYDHPVSPSMYEGFIEWHKKGVTAEYLRGIGETFAEQSGALYDYAKSMDYKSKAELRKDIAMNVLPALFHTVVSAVERGRDTHSEIGQSAEYQNAAVKSVVRLDIVRSALEELKRCKHPDAEEKEED